MDNNTAQNGTLQYPDLTQSVGNTSTPVVDTSTSSSTSSIGRESASRFSISDTGDECS